MEGIYLKNKQIAGYLPYYFAARGSWYHPTTGNLEGRHNTIGRVFQLGGPKCLITW